MRRDELEHIIRAAADVTGYQDLIVIGSQAILGQYPNAPRELLISMEADLYVPGHPEVSDFIDGALGRDTIFDAAQVPGVTPTEDHPHPHHCPLCGQGITRAHYRKAPKVQYDKRTHPIRLTRALAVNRPRRTIARRFGITEDDLELWIEQFPEMQAAVTAVEEEAGVLYEAAVAKALGAVDPDTGRYQGGDPQLLKMLLQTVHNIQDRKQSVEEDGAERLEKAVPIAMKLLKSLGDTGADDSAKG